MITQYQYSEGTQQLELIAQKHETALADGISNLAMADATKFAKEQARSYHGHIEQQIFNTLVAGGNTTADHYNKVLQLGLNNDELNDVVSKAIHRQYTDPYYGATLDQRHTAARIDMDARIKRSAVTGKLEETRKKNLVRIFRHSYPYGAAIYTDQRILLGQMVKLEHDIARELAKAKQVTLVKWTLSHKHTVEDICDHLATARSSAVEEYMESHNINLPSEGIYFVDQVPDPPHPNCRCELQFIYNGRLTGSIVERTLQRLKELLGRLGRKRKTKP